MNQSKKKKKIGDFFKLIQGEFNLDNFFIFKFPKKLDLSLEIFLVSVFCAVFRFLRLLMGLSKCFGCFQYVLG
jgi:hypothetical protein